MKQFKVDAPYAFEKLEEWYNNRLPNSIPLEEQDSMRLWFLYDFFDSIGIYCFPKYSTYSPHRFEFVIYKDGIEHKAYTAYQERWEAERVMFSIAMGIYNDSL